MQIQRPEHHVRIADAKVIGEETKNVPCDVINRTNAELTLRSSFVMLTHRLVARAEKIRLDSLRRAIVWKMQIDAVT